MPLLDTSTQIEEMQLQIRRKMTPAQRFQVALDISYCCRELRKAGIRRDHPDWTERQVMVELFRLAFLPHSLPAWVR